ncbi:MAG: outer membrane protein transport protein [Nitrospirota bacterium]
MRQNVWRKGLSALIFVFFVFCTIPKANGSGFAVYTQGASTLGQGAATIAHTDDPSAIFWNPALMNKLQGTQIQLGTTLIFPSRKFESDITGETVKTEPDVFFPSTFFITHKFNDKISAGLGVFNPFGLATKWPNDWEGRYIATNSEMTTFNINPVVSYQIIPQLSFAAGLDFLLLDATLEKNINQTGILSYLMGFPFPAPDIKQKFEGDGTGIGYNFGILLEPHRDISIGASYRSEIKVDIDGRATHDDVNPFLSAGFPNTNGDTDITLPQQIHVGVYYKGLDPLTFEVALRWEGWSSYDQLKISLDKPVFNSKTSVAEKDWEDTYSVSIGAKYQLNDSVALLAGYLYGGNPIPDKTFEPAIPDANTHLFCIGTSIKQKKFKVDLAYGYQILQEREKNNSITDPVSGLSAFSANGNYKSNLHLVAFSLTYIF